jgi:TfoX/Sxy family transcriptional regulator of competence genes
MTQPYLDRLSEKLRELKLKAPRGVRLECKHFFSGSALYANGRIAASLTPAGLALKLPQATRLELFRSRKATRLRYFTKGPVKKDYAVLSRSTAANVAEVRQLLKSSIRFVCSATSMGPAQSA